MPHAIRILLAVLALSCLLTSHSMATEEYAAATGRDCGVCHVSAAGGGELTAAGEGYQHFLASGTADQTATPIAPLPWPLRLLVGYLHILFAFFWFGTILYVHLILKPAYASKGLPRGEVRLGLASMVVMGITGALLFVDRVHSVAGLLDSRFGILLLIKIALYLVMVVSALLAVFVLGPRMRQKRSAATAAVTGDLPLEQLAQYDGKEGRPAYFAFRGAIYDASQSPRWKNGVHMGRHPAGGDLTEQLAQAPHGEEQVLAMPRIGHFLSTPGPALTPPQQAFYAMAYLNLGFVLAIIAILACWRWL